MIGIVMTGRSDSAAPVAGGQRAHSTREQRAGAGTGSLLQQPPEQQDSLGDLHQIGQP